MQLQYHSLRYLLILFFFALVILNIRISLQLYCEYSTCICTSLDPCFSMSASIGFRQYCHWLSVYRFDFWSAFRFIFLPVSVSAYITANSACICTSCYSFFSLSHCLSLNVYTSVRMYDRSFLVYMYVSWSVFLSLFLSLFMSVFDYIVTDCTYIGISLIQRFCLSLCTYVFLSVRVYYR